MKNALANIDRSEIVAAVAAVLVVFAPAIHKAGLDTYLNLDLNSTALLVAVAIGVAGYFIHRRDRAA